MVHVGTNYCGKHLGKKIIIIYTAVNTASITKSKNWKLLVWLGRTWLAFLLWKKEKKNRSEEKRESKEKWKEKKKKAKFYCRQLNWR